MQGSSFVKSSVSAIFLLSTIMACNPFAWIKYDPGWIKVNLIFINLYFTYKDIVH